MAFDNRQLLAGCTEGATEQQFSSGCICMYGKSYGQWKPFSEVDGRLYHLQFRSRCRPVFYQPQYDRTTLYGLLIRVIVHNGSCYVVPRALLILEAQACLIKLLHDFVISILATTNTTSTEDSTAELNHIDELKFKQPPLLEDSSKMRFAMSYYNVSMSTRKVLLTFQTQLS